MALAISTTKAEYVPARKSCQQALWLKQALIDYDIRLDDVLIIELDLELAPTCMIDCDLELLEIITFSSSL
ncbi:hypothetical protein Tco_0793604 [Tanacetum coccineum]